jgi:hypothetical protein
MSSKESKKITQAGGYCCSYCADSKFPCVNMEKALKSQEGRKADSGGKK